MLPLRTMFAKISLALLCFETFNYVQAFQPNCEPDNQFRFTCFWVDYCTSPEYCRSDFCGYYDKFSTVSVKIRKARILPTCAFVNSTLLQLVYGVNSSILVVANGAFKQLPQLESVHFAFNSIREMRHGIFEDVPKLTFLDLSYNKIAYIDKNAFSELTNLKTLNLSRNELITIPFTLSQSVQELIVSHNWLRTVVLNSKRFDNLSYIDLSHNVIQYLAISIDYAMKTIDLRDNKLVNIDYAYIWAVDELLLAVNEFVSVPKHLIDINAKHIQLYPNPWKCDELQKVWNKLLRYEIAVAKMTEEDRKQPICLSANESTHYSAVDAYTRIGPFKKLRNTRTRCTEDYHCLKNETCRTGKCWDPCNDEKLCDEKSICKSFNHTFSCVCPEKSARNPLYPHKPCEAVDCYQNGDCGSALKTCINRTCLSSDEACKIHKICPFYGYRAYSVPPTPTKPWWYFEIPEEEPPKAPSMQNGGQNDLTTEENNTTSKMKEIS